MIDDDDDFNEEAAERAHEFFLDRSSVALEEITAATETLRLCIDAVMGARLDGSALSGRVLDNHREQLLKIERNLNRAVGGMIGADPHPGF